MLISVKMAANIARVYNNVRIIPYLCPPKGALYPQRIGGKDAAVYTQEREWNTLFIIIKRHQQHY